MYKTFYRYFSEKLYCHSNTCHIAATCTEGPTEAECACIYGYEGDGKDCSDVDECARQPSVCHKDAVCTNVIGGHFCQCKPGFNGNGVDECKRKFTSCCDSNLIFVTVAKITF